MSTRMDREWEKFDLSTHALDVVSHEHRKIHAGKHFFVASYDTLTNAAVLDFAFTTPNTTEWSHMVFELEGTGALSMQIYEGSDFDADGTAVTPINGNRNSSNTSTLGLQTDPTVNAAGTEIYYQYRGANRSAGILIRDNEIIMKQNTKYLFRLTNQTAVNNIISWDFEWYEHVNKS